MLSAKACEVLRFLREHAGEYSIAEINQRLSGDFGDTIESLRISNQVERSISVENDCTVSVYSITEPGQAALEHYDEKQGQQRRQDRRYWITTGIAILALVKSFLPEISGVVAELLRLLMPQ